MNKLEYQVSDGAPQRLWKLQSAYESKGAANKKHISSLKALESYCANLETMVLAAIKIKSSFDFISHANRHNCESCVRASISCQYLIEYGVYFAEAAGVVFDATINEKLINLDDAMSLIACVRHAKNQLEIALGAAPSG